MDFYCENLKLEPSFLSGKKGRLWVIKVGDHCSSWRHMFDLAFLKLFTLSIQRNS